ncbi:MAG: hypothetical protein IPF83_01775 [Rhodanobacteraceae bacterium]|nr:hypothetical protein [Rhodanobacteraceae bacterium]
MTRFLDLLRRCYRWFRVPIWLGLGLVIGFLGPYLWYLDRLVRAGFDGLHFDTPSRVYARALELRPGRALDAETLLLELEAVSKTRLSRPITASTRGAWRGRCSST